MGIVIGLAIFYSKFLFQKKNLMEIYFRGILLIGISIIVASVHWRKTFISLC